MSKTGQKFLKSWSCLSLRCSGRQRGCWSKRTRLVLLRKKLRWIQRNLKNLGKKRRKCLKKIWYLKFCLQWQTREGARLRYSKNLQCSRGLTLVTRTLHCTSLLSRHWASTFTRFLRFTFWVKNSRLAFRKIFLIRANLPWKICWSSVCYVCQSIKGQ